MAETLVELVAKIKADSGELEKGLTDAEKQTEASSKKMSESLKKVGMAMAASGAAITAALGLMGKAAIDEDINIKRLAGTLGTVGISYDKVKDSLEGVIAETQRKTGIADNEQRDMLSRLILITQDYDAALKLMPIALDLAADAQMDTTTAATYLSKAYLDLEDGAEKVSVRFGMASVEFKNMEDIQARVAGKAEALANPLSVLKASIGDVAEEIGMNLIPLIKDATSKIVDIAIKVQEWTKEHPELSKTLTLVALALGGVLTVVGTLGLAIPPLVSGIRALVIVFGALKLVTIEYTLMALAAVVAIYGIINLVRSLKGEAYVGTGFGDTIFGQIKQDIASLMGGIQELLPTLDGLNNEIDITTKAGDNLSNTLDPELSKALKEVNDKADDLTDRFADLMRKLEDAESESGKLGLTMGDVYTAMYKLGYKTEQINDVFRRYGNITEVDESLLSELGLTAQRVAEIVGKLKEEIDKGTESFKKQGEEIEKVKTILSGYFAGGAGAEQYAGLAGFLEAGGGALYAHPSEFGSRKAAETYVEKYIGDPKAQEAYRSELAKTSFKYQHGGIIDKPTLALMGEQAPAIKEAVIPETMWDKLGGGVTIQFTQPVFFDREDTMNRFVDMIRKGVQRQDRLRFGGAYSG